MRSVNPPAYPMKWERGRGPCGVTPVALGLKKSETHMLIYLIYGPTCSGKTDLAIQIARETGWPVIALDRVQCCPQIANVSGRPLEWELQSTQRIGVGTRAVRSARPKARPSMYSTACLTTTPFGDRGVVHRYRRRQRSCVCAIRPARRD